MKITGREKRTADNVAVIYQNLNKIYKKAVKRFGEKKVIWYLSEKCYKINHFLTWQGRKF